MNNPIDKRNKVFLFTCLFAFVSWQLAKDDMKVINKYMKRFSVSVLIKGILIKMTKRYHFSPIILSRKKANNDIL